jgi:hypothetical protein
MLLSGVDYPLELIASVRSVSLLFKSCWFSIYIFLRGRFQEIFKLIGFGFFGSA